MSRSISWPIAGLIPRSQPSRATNVQSACRAIGSKPGGALALSSLRNLCKPADPPSAPFSPESARGCVDLGDSLDGQTENTGMTVGPSHRGRDRGADDGRAHARPLGRDSPATPHGQQEFGSEFLATAGGFRPLGQQCVIEPQHPPMRAARAVHELRTIGVCNLRVVLNTALNSGKLHTSSGHPKAPLNRLLNGRNEVGSAARRHRDSPAAPQQG